MNRIRATAELAVRPQELLATRVRHWPLLGLMLLALVHGLAYVIVVPIWQAPDEPMLYEYAALTAELGRVPTAADRSPALEARIAASLQSQGFWRRAIGYEPDPAPTTLAEAQALFFMPRQVGGDPPLYFLLAAGPLRLTAGWSVEAQVLLLRVLNTLLLPIVVLCTFLAARELVGDAVQGAGLVPFAAAALVALHPMASFVGAMFGNDGLANTLGAAICWATLWTLRRRLAGRGLLLLILLTTAALLTKRTALPYLLLTLLFAVLWAARWLWSGLNRAAWPSRLWPALAAAIGVIALGGWLGQQFVWEGAWAWANPATGQPAARVHTPVGPALLLRAGDEAVQAMPALGTALLRNGALAYGARVWSDMPARGRLVVYTGERRQEYAFVVNDAPPQIAAYVPTLAPDVRLGIVADQGWFYAGSLWVEGVGVRGDLLANGNLALPGLREQAGLQGVMRYLRVDELIWAVGSGRFAQPLPVDGWARWLFDSFWGHFGWMDLPFVRATFWEPLLLLVCAWGLGGSLLALAAHNLAPADWRGLALLLGLLPLALLPPLLNAYIDPHSVQQGRYLFPILAPVAMLLAYGQYSYTPLLWRRAWFAGWLVCWFGFAAAALARLGAQYGSG